MTSSRFLFSNGVVLHSPDTPSVSTFLESNPGAYTTTRTHNNATCLLFWERHLQRLANSARILFTSNPQFFFKSFPKTTHSSLPPPPPIWDSMIKTLVNDSVSKALPVALRERSNGEELAIVALVSGIPEKLSEIDVHLHIGTYVPPVFGVGGNGARLAVVGRGRDVAEAKYSDWTRLRNSLEKLRPPSVTELLLSNDGDRVLEGCVTNFFVVCRKGIVLAVSRKPLIKILGALVIDNNEGTGKYFDGYNSTCPFEVQTAPVSDGVLPGIIRQLVIEVCLSKGILFQEVAPSWSKREFWQEAFITNGLRIVQHVEKIQVPSSWESLELKTHQEISWEEKQFGEDPGMITTMIQKEIMERAGLGGYMV